MPITTTIDHPRKMIIATTGPMITDQDWLWLQAALRSLVDSGLRFDQLVDLRPAEDCRLSPNVMRLSAKNPALVPGRRQALVADNNLTYGMCRMYEILSASRALKIEVFRDIRSARRWLGLADSPRPQVASTKGGRIRARSASGPFSAKFECAPHAARAWPVPQRGTVLT